MESAWRKKPQAMETNVKVVLAMRLASAKFLRNETHHMAKEMLTKWFKRLTAKKMKKWEGLSER